MATRWANRPGSRSGPLRRRPDGACECGPRPCCRSLRRWPECGSRFNVSWTIKSRTIEPLAHIGVARHQPYSHAGRNRDHAAITPWRCGAAPASTSAPRRIRSAPTSPELWRSQSAEPPRPSPARCSLVRRHRSRRSPAVLAYASKQHVGVQAYGAPPPQRTRQGKSSQSRRERDPKSFFNSLLAAQFPLMLHRILRRRDS